MQTHDVIFKTLSDPTRRAIFERLCLDGEQTVVEMTKLAGISQPAVSKHLAVLKSGGLVVGRQAGRQTHYTAQKLALAPLLDWTKQMSGMWDEKLDGLEDLLRRMDQ